MRSTGKDETGAGEDGFGFFDKVDTKKAEYKEKWEDPFFRIAVKIVGLIFLIALCVNIIIGLAEWWWL
jgi:hypothetical protein